MSGVGQGLYDKNSGKLYAPAQLLPYEEKHKRKTRNTRRMDDKRQEIVVQYKRRCHGIIKKKEDLFIHVSKWCHFEMVSGVV